MSPGVKTIILNELNELYKDNDDPPVLNYSFTVQEQKEYYDYMRALEKYFGNDLPGKIEETKFFERYLKLETLK